MIQMTVSGNIAANAIVKDVNGKQVLTFSIGSNKRFKTKAGADKEETTFIFCELWSKKDLSTYFFKGRAITVNGEFIQRHAVNKDGIMQAFFKVRVANFQLFGKNKIEKQPVTPPAPAETNRILKSEPALQEPNDDLPF